MNRPGKQRPSTELSQLMPESCFMDLKQFNSPEVAEHIEDKEAHKKTLHEMLSNALKEKRKENGRR